MRDGREEMRHWRGMFSCRRYFQIRLPSPLKIKYQKPMKVCLPHKIKKLCAVLPRWERSMCRKSKFPLQLLYMGAKVDESGSTLKLSPSKTIIERCQIRSLKTSARSIWWCPLRKSRCLQRVDPTVIRHSVYLKKIERKHSAV